MTSYTLIDMKTLTDILSNLIKFGFGSYNELMSMDMDRIIRFYEWFMKDYKDEMKRKVEYDTAFAKAMICPLASLRKK